MRGERAAARLSLDAAPDTELLIERGWGSRWGVVSLWAQCRWKSLCTAAGDICVFNGVLFCLFVKGQLWW